MKAHDDLTFNVIGATTAYYDLTFNVIGATVESPSQNPLACLYKPRACCNKAELLRRNLRRVWLCLTRQGAGLADSRLTSPRDPLASLGEVLLPLSFCGGPPAQIYLETLQFNRVWSGAAFSKQHTHLSDLQGHANKATCPLNTEDSL